MLARCGYLHEEANIQFETTCLHCYEKLCHALIMDPDDDAIVLQQLQPTRGSEEI